MSMPQMGTTMAKRTKQSKSSQSNRIEFRPQSRPPQATERKEETWSPVMEGIIPLPPSLTVNATAPSNAETLQHGKKIMHEKFGYSVDQHRESVLYGPRKMR
ncbi:hypothetical protein RHMOL_Rhmol04G0353700 [Rhododendron molle]|uniref:Uncharacterized protein n=1 Tax=Rhododendron molle TaxID=49168 RepID=A0ACC0P7Y7_RHOML|nr:hypothetical protein RHMOL_Rhmol04G0353700 [Rhododendron molle]